MECLLHETLVEQKPGHQYTFPTTSLSQPHIQMPCHPWMESQTLESGTAP